MTKLTNIEIMEKVTKACQDNNGFCNKKKCIDYAQKHYGLSPLDALDAWHEYLVGPSPKDLTPGDILGSYFDK